MAARRASSTTNATSASAAKRTMIQSEDELLSSARVCVERRPQFADDGPREAQLQALIVDEVDGLFGVHPVGGAGGEHRLALKHAGDVAELVPEARLDGVHRGSVSPHDRERRFAGSLRRRRFAE